MVAWTAACRHLARDTAGLKQHRPADRTTLASTVVAVTMGPVTSWPAQLLPHTPCRDTRPRQQAPMHTPTAPLTAEQLFVVAAALLADGGESFVYHYGPAQITGSIQGPQRDAPDPWLGTIRERAHVRDPGGGTSPPGPQQGEALVLQTVGSQAILHGHAGGYRSHILAGGRWTVWHGTARQGAFPAHVDWQQEPTQAYYMTVDPWPLAVLLHTVSAPSKRQEPGWTNPPRTGLEPRPGGASTRRMARRRHQGHGRPRPPGGVNHARPRGGQLGPRMAHPQVMGSDHLPVRLALPDLLNAAGHAAMPALYSHTEGRFLPYAAEAARVQRCLLAAVTAAQAEPSLAPWLGPAEQHAYGSMPAAAVDKVFEHLQAAHDALACVVGRRQPSRPGSEPAGGDVPESGQRLQAAILRYDALAACAPAAY